MLEVKGVRWGWLKAMYILTIIMAGGFGLSMILVPGTMLTLFENSCDSATYGVVGSVYLAFGLIAILGLRAPLKFVPVLLLQLIYKAIWLVGVFLPLLVAGKFPTSEILTVVIFAITVVGDVIAIPFPYVFAKKE